MSTIKSDLDPFFYPKSVAVIGTNDVEGTVPFDIFYNILKDRLNGVVYPVSPGKKSIAGVRAYKYILDIEGPVDQAILVFPSSVCHLALEQCGKKGVKSVIIISAGFREVGEAGVKREQKLKDIAAKYGMRFIGPNCLGVINADPESNLNASFARKMPAEGNIAFLSQSGALVTGVLDYAQAKNIGFSKVVSFGNKADVSEMDLIYYLKDDPKTKVILIYLEEISNGPALMKAAQDTIRESGKPILLIKSGRTNVGAAAAASHTGSLAGSEEVCDAALRQAGIIRCTTLEEMFNKAVAMAYQPFPTGKRVAIITNAGGPGVLTTDAAINQGLELGKFSDETTEKFKKHLPKTANIKNPVDVIGDARADRYHVAVGSSVEDDGVDGVGVILTPQSMTEIEDIAEDIVNVAKQSKKPVYASFMGEMDVAEGVRILQRNHIPHYPLPESMMSAFSAAYNFKTRQAKATQEPKVFSDVNKAQAQKILKAAADQDRHHLPAVEAGKVLKAYGLPVLESALVNSADEAGQAGSKVGFPVVMKIVSDDIIHKVDVGGVVLNVDSAEKAKASYDQIVANAKKAKPDANIQGVLVEKMVTEGEEVILGLKRDPSFGAVVMFGLGGTFVEVFKDVSFRVAPLGADQIQEMIQEIKAYSLLTGARGKAPRDVASIVTCIQRLSQLAIECPEIQELDINPLIVGNEGSGCYVADSRIML